MSLAAEAAYFDGVPVQHIADYHEQQRLRRKARAFRTMEAANLMVGQVCADMLSGGRNG